MKLNSKTIITIGILLIIFGFIYDVLFAGIPYQDPTPEMTQKYNLNRSISSVIMSAGGASTLLAVLKNLINKVFKK